VIALSPALNFVFLEHVTAKIPPRPELPTDVAEQNVANRLLAFAGFEVTKIDELFARFAEHAGPLVLPHGLLVDEKSATKRTRNLHRKQTFIQTMSHKVLLTKVDLKTNKSKNFSFSVSVNASIEQCAK